MVRKTDGKWWTDKDPNLRFDTMEMAKEAEAKLPEPKPVEPKPRRK